MRLWTVHPKYLDTKGIVAAWREALLAQKVLRGETRGYRHHPQLVRFQAHPEPVHAIGAFLAAIAAEAAERGYSFDESKIFHPGPVSRIAETRGQLLYEWSHLTNKLQTRAPEVYARHRNITAPQTHPLFRIVAGGIRPWEKTLGNE